MKLYTITEIAQQLGISRAAVHQRVRWRVAALGRQLGQKHGGVWLFTQDEVRIIREEVQK